MSASKRGSSVRCAQVTVGVDVISSSVIILVMVEVSRTGSGAVKVGVTTTASAKCVEGERVTAGGTTVSGLPVTVGVSVTAEAVNVGLTQTVSRSVLVEVR